MNTWMDTVRPESRAARGMANEILDIPEAFDLADEMEEVRVPVSIPKASFDPRAWILRGIAAFTSASCAITSVYFSNKWFIDSQPRFIAGIMSLTVVATLTVAPELSVSLARKKNYITAVVVALISVIATLFSMSSTIGGIYNARTSAIKLASEEAKTVGSEEMASLSSAAAEIEVLKERVARLSRSLESDQTSLASYQGAIDKLLLEGEEPESKKMATLVANRYGILRRISMAEAGISSAEKRINDLLPAKSRGDYIRSSTVERLDFASWLGDRLGLSADQMEFVLAAFPAVFIDLIAPAMLVVAFTL